MINAGTYKWIHRVSVGHSAPVGGIVGCFGAFGGFIVPNLFLGMAAKAGKCPKENGIENCEGVN